MSGAIIGAAAITAAGSYMAAKNTGSSSGSGSGSGTETTTETAVPTWSEEQTPYVWGEGYEFPTYRLSDAAKAYGSQLTEGYRGADGTSIAPMSSSDLVAAILGTGTAQNQANYQSLLGVNSTPRLTYDQLWAQPTEQVVAEQPVVASNVPTRQQIDQQTLSTMANNNQIGTLRNQYGAGSDARNLEADTGFRGADQTGMGHAFDSQGNLVNTWSLPWMSTTGFSGDNTGGAWGGVWDMYPEMNTANTSNGNS